MKDHPDKLPHKRSRIGNTTLLLDGPDLYEILKTEPEDRKYYLNDGFSVTLGIFFSFHERAAIQRIRGKTSETRNQKTIHKWERLPIIINGIWTSGITQLFSWRSKVCWDSNLNLI